MKILKIFGAVMAAHAVAFLVIFANPGCSSTKSGTPPAEPIVKSDPVSSLPPVPQIMAVSAPPAAGLDAPAFDPNAPAVPAGRYSPTRPAAAAAAGPGGGSFDPNAPAAPAAPAPSTSSTTSYTAVGGDSLWSVSKKHGLTVAELAQANRLPNTAELKIGQKLVIPSKTAPAAGGAAAAKAGPVTTPAAKADGAVTHVVKAGETINGIAQQWGLTPAETAELVRINNIPDPARIRPGTTLVIPGAKAVIQPAAKAGTGATPATRGGSTPASAPPRPPPAADIPMIRVDEPGPRLP